MYSPIQDADHLVGLANVCWQPYCQGIPIEVALRSNSCNVFLSEGSKKRLDLVQLRLSPL